MSSLRSEVRGAITPPSEGIDHLPLDATRERYEEERQKRLRDDGNSQFIQINQSAQHERFADDPWADPADIQPLHVKFPDKRSEMLIIGAGWGGIQIAVRMIQAGIPAKDIRIIDPAGGFGGTWYWNRFPGLMCDIESYTYLPFLEETGYVPKHRYSYGEEIRQYANLVAQKWGLVDCAVFKTQATETVWNEDTKEWVVQLVQRHNKDAQETLQIRSKFVTISTGPLNWPKLPDIPGLLDYQGDIFHAARWAYNVTGGSPTDPALTKLKGKNVAIVGTGGTAVEVVPRLAKWCKHLYVIQRTPGSVGVRNQRATDEEWFRKEVAGTKGWQRERIRNFHQHFTLGETPSVNMVDDEWTRAPGLVGLTGNKDGPKLPEEIPAYVVKVFEADLPYQKRIHHRIDQEVKDPAIAEKLKPWYPIWCKRPLFHNEYLTTFNRNNVTLVDTEGRGMSRMTKDSVVVGDTAYQVDIVIFATGYLAPPAGTPAEKANMIVKGLNGVSMSEEWPRVGPTTLHGIIDAKFPNLFLASPQQAAASGNYRFNLDEYAKHMAYILTESKRRANGAPFAVAPSAEAAENWAMQVTMHSAPMGVIIGCTPGYFNMEGDLDRLPREYQMALARSGPWGSGIEDWVDLIERWRADGKMEGIEVSC